MAEKEAVGQAGSAPAEGAQAEKGLLDQILEEMCPKGKIGHVVPDIFI